MVPTHESVVSLAMLSLDIDCLILEDWCMVLVFDKKTPENAFNNTKSNRVVGEQIFLALIKNIPVQVLLTVAAQTIFLNDFKLKSVQVDHSHTVSVPHDGPSLCNIYFISILHNIHIFNYDFVVKILLDVSSCQLIVTILMKFPPPPKSYATIFLEEHRTLFWSN